MDLYHFFSDPEYAGPGPIDVLKFWDFGGYTLRTKPRKSNPLFQFPNSTEKATAVLATVEDAKKIAVFWNNYYKGDDWNFACSWADVARWINSGFILLLKHESEIVGTFVCHVLSGVFCGKFNIQAALIDGLVVAPWLRGKGVASFLLAAMDYTIYNRPDLNQAIVIWFREHNSRIAAVNQNPICILEYSFVKINEIQKRNKYATDANPELVMKHLTTIYQTSRDEFTLLLNSVDDPDVYWFMSLNSIVGIAYTHRVATGNYTIWEVVFAANLEMPYFTNLQIPIEMAALKLPCVKGLLFASNSKSRGNKPMSAPWTTGNSGYLTTHVYNWMPPTFLNGDILFPMSCI